MLLRSFRIFILTVLVLTGGIYCFAQSGADNRSSIFAKPGESEDDNRPKSFKDTLYKLRIDREKKDYDEMISRGEEALKISEELEKSFARNGRLTANEYTQIETVEKLVKKIRNELGGDDDKETKDGKRLSPSDAVKSFRETTVKLIDELKKTSRFTISASAIQASNAVLRLTRFLRGSN